MKLIIIVNPCLGGGLAVAQAMHAALGFAAYKCGEAGVEQLAEMNAVILQPRPEQWDEGAFLTSDNYIWREPDMDDEIMAVAVNPWNEAAVKNCRQYPLMRP